MVFISEIPVPSPLQAKVDSKYGLALSSPNSSFNTITDVELDETNPTGYQRR
jgi:hypothetical protein